MAVQVVTTVTLALTPTTGAPSTSGVGTLAYRKQRYCAFQAQQSLSTSSGDNAIDLGALTDVKNLYIAVDSPVTVKLSSAGHAAQVVPLDNMLYIECPNAPITAITITGATTGTIALAGD